MPSTMQHPMGHNGGSRGTLCLRSSGRANLWELQGQSFDGKMAIMVGAFSHEDDRNQDHYITVWLAR